jgi:hypothetical protein
LLQSNHIDILRLFQNCRLRLGVVYEYMISSTRSVFKAKDL